MRGVVAVVIVGWVVLLIAIPWLALVVGLAACAVWAVREAIEDRRDKRAGR